MALLLAGLAMSSARAADTTSAGSALATAIRQAQEQVTEIGQVVTALEAKVSHESEVVARLTREFAATHDVGLAREVRQSIAESEQIKTSVAGAAERLARIRNSLESRLRRLVGTPDPELAQMLTTIVQRVSALEQRIKKLQANTARVLSAAQELLRKIDEFAGSHR
jgi:peptidoglycan hydrolase CwlO-like protein